MNEWLCSIVQYKLLFVTQADTLGHRVTVLERELKDEQAKVASTRKQAVREVEEKLELEMKEQQLVYQRRIQANTDTYVYTRTCVCAVLICI